jgi:Ser/Thr protein kinase RdoA (MazF antagonist)
MLCVPDTVSPQHPDDLHVLEECGKAFGCFSRRLNHFPAATLHETIIAFHDTPNRLRQLEDAISADPCGRVKDVAEEIAFARAREAETRILLEAHAAGKLPLRVTHNDTKVNNVLLDRDTGKAVCVIDLDTVMPGLLAYDFGDAIRVGACSTEEDERDLEKVRLELPKAEAFARGFLGELKGALSEEELLSLEAGARLMTFECGMRFLADHLNGDKYFRIHRPGQNLDRARTQFALLADMEKHQEEMRAMLTGIYRD